MLSILNPLPCQPGLYETPNNVMEAYHHPCHDVRTSRLYRVDSVASTNTVSSEDSCSSSTYDHDYDVKTPHIFTSNQGNFCQIFLPFQAKGCCPKPVVALLHTMLFWTCCSDCKRTVSFLETSVALVMQVLWEANQNG